MKLTTTLFISLYCIIGYTSFAQSPSFSANLNISNSFVCYGGQMSVNATVANADFYQFQKRNESTNTWENIAGASGNPTTSAGAISHTFYGIIEAITTRVFISKNAEIVYSNDITITPQRPIFSFQPLDITECNGSDAIFRTSATGVGTISYLWQENVGGVFQNATNSTDFSGMNTANLTVKSLANTENGRIFRCLVKDQNNCENYSSSATLSVNQLSTVISPTLTTTFCEGDTAQFSVALKVGTVNSYEWQLKRTTDAIYSNLAEGNHFGGVNTEKLSVKGILPTENSYRLNVNFVSLGQNANGTRATGTCPKTATRAGYTIRSRPTPPIQIDDVYRCGIGKISTNVTGTGTFYWYSDSTKAPITSNNANFTSPVITETKPYFYSVKDVNQCESFKRSFSAVIRPLPTQSFEKVYSICPKDNNFVINFSSVNNTPQQLYVLNHTPALPNFSQIVAGTFSNNFAVPLPNDLASGNYKFKVFTKNLHCYSDTSTIDLIVKKSTKIEVSPVSKTICEGMSHTFDVQYQSEAPTSFKWLKNNILLSSELASTLSFGNLGLADEGQYKVEVTGQCGVETSEIAQLAILPKIKITKQPRETIVCQNGSTKFVIEATGSGTLAYEWTLNGALVGTNSPELSLQNVPISNHQAKIKCKITSDCEPITFSDEVLLLVDDLPVAPSVASPLGFCKSNSLGSLVATASPKHSLRWFNNTQNMLNSNQIDISTVFNKTFYVSQIDSNLCESTKAELQVITNEPFTINVTADKANLCSTGLFNRIGFLNTSVSPSNYDLTGISYKLLKNNSLTETNSIGEFEINGGGIYKVIAAKNYCSDSSEITILSLHSELSTNPLTTNYQICKNTDLTLTATGSYNGGSFFWYSSEFSPLQIYSGADYSISNQAIDQTYYVSYGITTNGIYCETPRSITNIVIKPDLIIETETTNTSCIGINDGKVSIQINNGVSPYSFFLNGTSNPTGIFENLAAGTFIISALDAVGCVGEKTITIGINPGVSISQQPSNISRCKTNVANFTLVATNYDQILWERKLPNATNFEPIAGENLSNLRIENIGNTTNPHLTKYRAKLTKGNCSIYSDEVVLFVNSISGTGSSKTVCENSFATFNLNEYTIIGTNKTYQWQYRQGSSGNFTDITGKTAETLSINNVLATNDGYYRCKMTFDNGSGNSCIINTSTSGTKLTVDIPQIPILSGEKTICSGQTTTLSATNCTGTLTWSDGKTGLIINVSPSITTTYTATCNNGACNSISSNSVKITVENGPLNAPNIILSRTKYCVGEKVSLNAENCIGTVVWSNGLQGNSIEITATVSFNISAHCKTEFCQSPESQTINVVVYPVLTAGSIVSNSTINCSGFNPLTINSVANPSGGNIQWQKSENCSVGSPIWINIDGETGLTYNPPALLTSTCFRRMVSDSCQTLFSNITDFEIRPDPILEISADKNQICFGQKVTLNKTLTGGEGICGIQWQINKVSSAVSSTFWTNLSIVDILEFNNNNSGNDSTFHFRARVDCSNSSCNLATSNAVSVVFHPQLSINVPFSDSTICSRSSITLSSSGCKANILWSTGETSAQISVSPSVNTIYTVSCKNACDEISKSVNIKVVTGISTPIISVLKTKYCHGENIQISASNCGGEIIWSNGLSGTSINITAANNFSISTHCVFQKCHSPESQTINIVVYPVLTAGSIVSNSTINCSGFNPLTINSVTNPSGGNIQWQKSENCSAGSPIWTNIVTETGLTYNPPVLLTSTCFRRMVSDSCQTLFSNITNFEIHPDPVLEISADKNQVCFGQKVTLSKTLTGGEGICGIQWQINKVSSAVSSAFWTNLAVSDILEFTNNNSGNDSTFHFRARVDCSNSSCNLATSNAVSVVFHPQLSINVPFSDSTICSGSSITLSSSGCKANILWSTGETSAQISVSPSVNTNYTVSCKNACDEISKSVNIKVVAGISTPIISVSKTKYCFGENIQISASNCDGENIWSNGLSGTSINISAVNNFSISVHCIFQKCQSPESQTINVVVYPVLAAGTIVSNSAINCSGFNPLTINSVTNPNGGNIQWQKSENCSIGSPIWTNIDGETGLTYNPPALLTSTCFRRMVSDSCQTFFSNITHFEIRPDPILEISADKTQICFGQKVILSKTLVGGEGICEIQWQINKVSSAVSSAFWTNLSIADILEFTNNNSGNDSTFYFRAKVDCSNSSCNLATSNVVSVVFHPSLVLNTAFSDSTICSGSSITLSSSGCKANILWSTGETSTQISVSSSVNTIYTVSCKNACDEISKSVNIKVVAGISTPIISVSKTKYCHGENIQISASNCAGEIIWSNGLSGTSINISAATNFSISAHCVLQKCKSPESQTINIVVYPVLAAGSIVSNSTINCSGFNPLTINSVTNPNGGNIQWQKSENCSAENPVWVNIATETGQTYNPPALLTSTCFRRMVSDSCQTLFSNITNFEIHPDPVLEISADKTQICFGQKVTLNKTLVGGEGICGIQWQINKVSSGVSSTFWTNLTVSDILEFNNNNSGNDSTFHFRARVDCSNSSCNLATSNAVSVVFHPALVLNTAFSDSTICSGSSIILSSLGCKANILWSTGETSAQISVSPSVNTIYTVSCKNACDEISKSINIQVVSGISEPIISVSKTKYCHGENIQISASNCDGEVIWSNGLLGTSINISATNNFSISAHCISQKCKSPESQTINIVVYPVITAGSIVSNTTINCSGFNPLTINSVTNPSGGNIQWQKSENCSIGSPIWTNIDGETGLTYNPPALLTSTCFRRMVSDSCQTLFSNITNFEIRPDPILEISADKNQSCFGQKVTLNKTLTGGEGICGIQWQINKVSSAVSSTFWTNLSIIDVLEFTNNNTGNDSTFHFRARVDCSNSSCNLATSNAVSVVFHPALVLNTTFSDYTICSGSSITLSSSGCKANILWSTGETSAQISVSPSVNTNYTVSCKNACDEISKSVNIKVVAGIEKPLNTTPESFLSPSILAFSATGQNLKWYSSASSSVFLTQAPVINIPGDYTFWVTQTIEICESPRLEIHSKLFPALQITSQTNSIINCFGNTSNIEINALGSGILKYKWQRKRPNETTFSDIMTDQNSLENYDSKELKIKSVGNVESPHLTKFRCIIKDDFSEIQSEEMEIIVNRLLGNLANQKLCLGNNFDLNLNNSHIITGSPTHIQWQQRQGTGADWTDLKDSANFSGTNALHFSVNNLTLENQKQYRCSVLFNSTTGTCTETTDLMSLTVGSFPQTPENKGFEFCQNVSSPKLELYEPNNMDVIWYLPGSQNALPKQPIIDTKIAGDQIYFYSFKNSGDCESPKATVQIIIHPEPPRPVNITPNQVIEGQTLVFAAVGEKLKWYTSRTGRTFTSISPTYQKIGSYDHYVSQTSPKGCESDREYIESEIIAAFGIITQPINQANCEDNTSTFSIKTKGSNLVIYRWQILKNGIFEDILGENTSSLRIDDVGKAPHVDGTVYRCIVSNSTQEIISNEVTLKVNKIDGKLTDLSMCENTTVNALKFKENIIGNVAQVEWQRKEADSYSTLFISKKLEENFSLNHNNSGDYRLRVTFQNQGSSTCVRTSNTFKITINKRPEPLEKVNYSVCQYSSLKTVIKQFPDNFVLKNLDSSLVSFTFFNESKPISFIGNYTNEKGCSSDFQKLNFDILQAPKAEISDTILTYCQFSSEVKSLKINNLNTFWFSSETEDESTENEFSINTSSNQTQYRWLAIESLNGCLSKKTKIKIDFNLCFFEEKKDTCLNRSGKLLVANEWNYFYDTNGRIFAAIHPTGQNLGIAKIDFRDTMEDVLKDKNQTSLYPRYFNVQTSKKSNSDFKIRFYMTLEEISKMGAKTAEDISIINYGGKNQDCDLLNNALEDNYWLETNSPWHQESQQNVYFVEFNTQKTGEFGLWNSVPSKGILSGKVNDVNIPELNISEKSNAGKYIIMKSKDGKNWFEWSQSTEKTSFLDLKPFLTDNYYQLIYDYGNGIKSIKNSLKLTIPVNELPCLIIENPSENRDLLKVYFPNIDKTTVRLNTAMGQLVGINKVLETADYLEVYPSSQLSAGFYTLHAQNTDGKYCSLKIWMR